MTLPALPTQYAFVLTLTAFWTLRMPDDQQSKGPRLPMAFMVVGSEMATFTLVGVLLDFALGTMPWLTIGLTLFGVVAAFVHLVSMARAMQKGGTKKNGDVE